MPAKKPLAGKVVLVTGGGSGLGAATAKMLGEAGAEVKVADLNEESAIETARHILLQKGSATAVKLDIREEQHAQHRVEELLREFRRIDILVNNAGINITATLETLSATDWDQIMETNLRGAFLLSKFVFPVMEKQGSGHIINICSTLASRATEITPAYIASKWGLRGLSHSLFLHGRKCGVKVTALLPGGMRTPLILKRFPDINQRTLMDPEPVARTILHVVTLPEEVAIPELTILSLHDHSWP